MIKEFEIQGRILNFPPEMTEEEFWHAVIGFIEENGWSFGGGLEMEKISGCISGTSPDMTAEEFEKIFLDFVERNGWSFEGSIKIYEPEVAEFQYSFSDILDDLKVGREIEFEYNGKMYGIFNSEGNWFFFADNRDELLCQFEETDTLLEKVKNLSINLCAQGRINRIQNHEYLDSSGKQYPAVCRCTYDTTCGSSIGSPIAASFAVEETVSPALIAPWMV